MHIRPQRKPAAARGPCGPPARGGGGKKLNRLSFADRLDHCWVRVSTPLPDSPKLPTRMW